MEVGGGMGKVGIMWEGRDMGGKGEVIGGVWEEGMELGLEGVIME